MLQEGHLPAPYTVALGSGRYPHAGFRPSACSRIGLPRQGNGESLRRDLVRLAFRLVHARTMQSHSPGSPSTPQPDTAAGFASRANAGDESFPDATSDFGLKPRPRTRRVDPLLGTDLGGIRIIRLLGEGGMGRVYEAEQESPRRTVAVKVIRQGITSEKTMRRFEREAEFLGRLQHPCIAQIYVVGSYSSDDGDVPFFVMEFIANAKPINNFAAEQSLSLDDRLRLFVSVCEAVAHGHDRGIVHRDLKPGNILIDADGLPKVIDFGVARSTDSDLQITSMKTDTGQLVGTVQYMSPEQFGDSPEGLDGRADVYSLGVVLYELLGGVLPYEVRKKKMHEAARIICEEIQPALRARDKSIPRDVSLIVDRCLEKNRRMRYQGAGALAADIRRYLAGHRIPLSWKDVIRPQLRLLRRPAVKVTLLMLVLTLAALGIAGVLGIPGLWTKPTVSTTPLEIPPEVSSSLRQSLDASTRDSGNLSASVDRLRQNVDLQIHGVRRDSCERLLYEAWPLWENEAERCTKVLSRAWVEASQAYPQAPDEKLLKRYEKWAAEVTSLREQLGKDFESVRQDCSSMIAAAQTNPAEDALNTAERDISFKLTSWREQAVKQAGGIVDEGTKDLWAYASQLSGQANPKE